MELTHLNLPVKLDIIRDIKVKCEVEKVANTFVMHGVKTFKDDDRGWLDGLWGIKGAVPIRQQNEEKGTV